MGGIENPLFQNKSYIKYRNNDILIKMREIDVIIVQTIDFNQ